MKKVKVIIAILVLLILIIAGVLIILNINKEKAEAKAKEEQYKEKISSMNFKIPEYQSIEDVVFYSGATEEMKNDFINIANTMKEEYPGRSILYVRQLSLNETKIYRFEQIDNGQILEHTEMNVTISEDNTVSISLLGGQSWKEGNDINNIKVSAEEAKEITINYLLEHPESYRKMYSSQGVYLGSGKQCNIEFFQYKSKPVWKMAFGIGGSYIIIDANTGRILDTYFFNGVIVN